MTLTRNTAPLAEACYQAAGGNPWLALWLAINVDRIAKRHEQQQQKRAA